MPDFSSWLCSRLAEIDQAQLRRRLRVVDSPQLTVVQENGRELINFSSNDYLGLASDDRLREAALVAIDDWGVGSGASRLISGTQRPHEQLEHAIADFKSVEAALVFANGFAAAIGTIPAIVGKGDVIILDKLSHACLVDGARMSGAVIRVFPHNRILVITESVFSMDSDRAPLREIVELKDRYGAWLLLDEAHAMGVIGAQGRGLAWECGVADRVELQMGTLGKALGASGGYIAGSRCLIDWLINRARAFIFSTAPPAAIAAAATTAIEIVRSEVGDQLRDRLWANIRGCSSDAESAIIPVLIGDAGEAVAASERLLDAGCWIPAVRFPTVPKGGARLRISLSAAHTADQISRLKNEVFREL
jgi:8-amino-7-oxononanoate synthase